MVRQHAEYDRLLQTTLADDALRQIKNDVQENERQFIPIASLGWIGNWQNHFPLPKQQRMESAQQQLGPDFLLQITK